jgi:hypothetical protein
LRPRPSAGNATVRSICETFPCHLPLLLHNWRSLAAVAKTSAAWAIVVIVFTLFFEVKPSMSRLFKEEITHYNARHFAKPGITGCAQSTACAAIPA